MKKSTVKSNVANVATARTYKPNLVSDLSPLAVRIAAILKAVGVTQPIKPYWTVKIGGTAITVYALLAARGIDGEAVKTIQTRGGYIVAHLATATAPVVKAVAVKPSFDLNAHLAKLGV